MKKNCFFYPLALAMGFFVCFTISCGKDDDCTTKNFYLDKDLDGFGAGNPTKACSAPTAATGQYVTDAGDPDDNDANVNPSCELTLYLDNDGDGFGTGNPILFCVNPDPTKYTDFDGAFDCDDDNAQINPDVFITYYRDSDEDGYGDANETISLQGCEQITEGYVSNLEDCDDTDPNINPGINNDDPNDGIDSNCDGAVETVTTIWNGPNIEFSKVEGEVNWIDLPQYHDQLTENVSLTRSNNGYITNISWWENVVMEAPTEKEDLVWEYLGRKSEGPIANIGDATSNGGPHGVRWAILEPGGETTAWDNFNLYGTLGDPNNFYSFNNIVSICDLLDSNHNVVQIIDDFGVEGSEEEFFDYSGSRLFYDSLEGKSLGVWLVEEDIYFTITFTELTGGNSNGPSMTYTRSTPNN